MSDYQLCVLCDAFWTDSETGVCSTCGRDVVPHVACGAAWDAGRWLRKAFELDGETHELFGAYNSVEIRAVEAERRLKEVEAERDRTRIAFELEKRAHEQTWDHKKEIIGERDTLRTTLLNLYARIFRDGGHHYEQVGPEQAARDADETVARLNAEGDQLRTRVAELEAWVDVVDNIGRALSAERDRVAELEGRLAEVTKALKAAGNTIHHDLCGPAYCRTECGDAESVLNDELADPAPPTSEPVRPPRIDRPDKRPLPPEVLADALQDRCYPASGRLLGASPVVTRPSEPARDLTPEESEGYMRVLDSICEPATAPAEAPKCAYCGAPATCLGAYEGAEAKSYACDACCGHGQEDGHCEPVADDAIRQAVEEEREAALEIARDEMHCPRGPENCAGREAAQHIFDKLNARARGKS